jgi:hypothetical protein
MELLLHCADPKKRHFRCIKNYDEPALQGLIPPGHYLIKGIITEGENPTIFTCMSDKNINLQVITNLNDEIIASDKKFKGTFIFMEDLNSTYNYGELKTAEYPIVAGNICDQIPKYKKILHIEFTDCKTKPNVNMHGITVPLTDAETTKKLYDSSTNQNSWYCVFDSAPYTNTAADITGISEFYIDQDCRIIITYE